MFIFVMVKIMNQVNLEKQMIMVFGFQKNTQEHLEIMDLKWSFNKQEQVQTQVV